MNSQQQWQLIVIQKIETASDWLGTSERKKNTYCLYGVFLVVLLLWGMFFVPTTILLESAVARNLVQFTASILPWINMAQVNYGAAADKFVYWQCVSVWALITPTLISAFADRVTRLNKKIKGKEFYNAALLAFPAGILGFIFGVILPNLFHSSTYVSKAQHLLMLNEYFSALGAVLLAMLFDAIFIGMIITIFYLIHFFRNFQQLFKY